MGIHNTQKSSAKPIALVQQQKEAHSLGCARLGVTTKLSVNCGFFRAVPATYRNDITSATGMSKLTYG